tara:strand:+ start:250 stop:450 length:201 start_codon:yes stop_codon:yes gene_type:complete
MPKETRREERDTHRRVVRKLLESKKSIIKERELAGLIMKKLEKKIEELEKENKRLHNMLSVWKPLA